MFDSLFSLPPKTLSSNYTDSVNPHYTIKGTHLDIQNAKGTGNGATLPMEPKALGISNLVLDDKYQLCQLESPEKS